MLILPLVRQQANWAWNVRLVPVSSWVVKVGLVVSWLTVLRRVVLLPGIIRLAMLLARQLLARFRARAMTMGILRLTVARNASRLEVIRLPLKVKRMVPVPCTWCSTVLLNRCGLIRMPGLG